MTKWKTWKLGKTSIYRKDGRPLKAIDVPPEIVERLRREPEFDTESNVPIVKPEPVVDRSCIFCGAYSKNAKLINGQSIYTCEEHYYSESTGKILQRWNEVNLQKSLSSA